VYHKLVILSFRIRSKDYTISFSYPTKTKTLQQLEEEINANYEECL